MTTTGTSSSIPKSAFRSLIRSFSREQRRSSVVPRSVIERREDPLSLYLRQTVKGAVNVDAAAPPQRLANLISLLLNGRVHEELLARYNPVYGKSNQEHIRATANRVGLDVPTEYEDLDEGASSYGRASIDAKYRS